MIRPFFVRYLVHIVRAGGLKLESIAEVATFGDGERLDVPGALGSAAVPVVAAHMLLYTPEADALRAVFRDVFGWTHVEDHPGWLIFAMPPSELGIHPSEGSTKHEISLMCDDLESTIAELRAKGIEFRGEPQDRGFGVVTTMVLPGGVEVLLYESKHRSPLEKAGGIEQA